MKDQIIKELEAAIAQVREVELEVPAGHKELLEECVKTRHMEEELLQQFRGIKCPLMEEEEREKRKAETKKHQVLKDRTPGHRDQQHRRGQEGGHSCVRKQTGDPVVHELNISEEGRKKWFVGQRRL